MSDSYATLNTNARLDFKLENIVIGKISNSSNYRKTLFDMINLSNPKKYSISIADFRMPLKAPDDSIRNSTILLVEVPDLGLFNPILVWYNRIHSSELGIVTLIKRDAVTTIDLLDQINQFLDSTVTASDLQNVLLPDADANGNVSFLLSFNNNSTRYYSGVPVVLKVNSAISLASANIPVTKLSLGLDKVDNVSDKDKPLSSDQLQSALAAQIAMENYVNNAVLQSNNGSSQPVWSLTEW